MLLGAWITVLVLSVLGASDVRAWIAHDRVLGKSRAMLATADALVAVSELTHAHDLSEAASSSAARAKPDTVWLRESREPASSDPETVATKAADVRLAPARSARPAAAAGPVRVLLIGASSMQLHFGAELERALRSSYRDVTVKRLGRIATGLVRTDYFDWPAKTRELVESFHPDVVVAQFGGNDAQTITIPHHAPLAYASPAWDEELGDRVTALVDLVRSRDARFVAVGMPMMREPKFSRKMAHVNAIIEARVTAAGGTFIPTWDLSGQPNGKYGNSITLDGTTHLLRSTDGVHFTRPGAIYMARKVLERLERHVVLAPREDARAVVVRREIASTALGRTVPYLAFVPPREAREGGELPVLFLLHGADGAYTDWAEHAQRLLQELAAEHRLVIVTPEGGAGGWYVDTTRVPDSRYETHIVEEIAGDVDAHLPSNGLRGIAGVSMGGHGAITLALRHPGLFASASSMSGVVDLTHASTREALVARLGPYEDDPAGWEAHSAAHLLAANVARAQELPLLFTVGSADRWAPENRALSQRLDALAIAHVFDEHEGGHDWPTWTGQLPRHVAWHAARLSPSRR